MCRGIDMSRLDSSVIKGDVSSTVLSYDYLVVAVGAEVQTFGIPGVKENACFMKELADAERVCEFLFYFRYSAPSKPSLLHC